ncbi:RNA polymerase sigma factor RpoD, partial [Pasteurella multocida subsp. multocida str. Anand1_cattle]
MPKEQFQKVFIGHENKDTWLVKALSSGKTWS